MNEGANRGRPFSKGSLSLPTGPYPSTRYSGSKRRLLPQLYSVFKELAFDSAADLFGGTGTVSFLFKRMKKQVIFNDNLWSNYWSAVGLIENSTTQLTEQDVTFLLECRQSRLPGKAGFVQRTFKGLYFTDEENRWIDTMAVAIEHLETVYDAPTGRFKKALALHALCQSALRKRPFNMFHRANLGLRLAHVARSFGNLTTWETPFQQHFLFFVREVNNLVFDNDKSNKAFCKDARSWHLPQSVDLVYIDPPYVPKNGSWATVDYLPKYHFLEGMVRYPQWPSLVDFDSPLKMIRDGYQQWIDEGVKQAGPLPTLGILVERYKDSVIALSYKDPGDPSIDELVELIKAYKERVQVFRWPYRYVLAQRNHSKEDSEFEVLIVGTSLRSPR